LVINASLFVPQSRPRLFVIGVRDDVEVDEAMLSPGPIAPFHTAALQRAFDRVESKALKRMIWWNIPSPPHRNGTFANLIEENPDSVAWHTPVERDQVLKMMSPVNKAKVEAAKRAGRRMVGGIYKRTRHDEQGVKVQRAEVRFDDVAGCLRTPAGGSSRQVIMVVDGQKVRTRLISSRETARLMGLQDTYILPRNYNEAYHLTGDGVAVHVVRHLAEHIFEPLLGIEASASMDVDGVEAA
jgi:DNA (cytosine-5)-methyltransferase 1